MNTSRKSKPVPLSGDTLSTGVPIARATAKQLNMEANRVIKRAAQRCGEASRAGKVPDDDAEYQESLARAHMLNALSRERLLAEADQAGVGDMVRQAIQALEDPPAG